MAHKTAFELAFSKLTDDEPIFTIIYHSVRIANEDIDKYKDIAHVINMEVPNLPESHEGTSMPAWDIMPTDCYVTYKVIQ